ncbi:hypothetical protein KJ632_02670 [Patescibacteria group bacterium]|nr:hypothetical protein [Patescibacteria group bacterium]
MENAMAIAAVMGPFYLVLGLSVLMYAEVWQKVFKSWKKDHISLVALSMLLLVAGLISVNMYNVWEMNIWLIVTVVSWILVLKGVFYMLAPGELIKDTLDMGQNKGLLYFGGLVSVVLGGVLSYYTYFV